MAFQRSPEEWARHARLIGAITERVALVLSNTTKEKILDSITMIEREAKREYAAQKRAEERGRFTESDEMPSEYVRTTPKRTGWSEVDNG